jgi:glycosyltransferase involved in cell wall biosynthesis
MNTPRVTFLLPVHNGAATIAQTIESILGQTLADVELLLMDDASTDESAEIIRGYPDARIRIVQNERHMELAATLNRGLTLAQADYVARIDADDISLPRRAAVQADFLDAHPTVSVVGSFLETFGDGDSQTVRFPLNSCDISAALLFRNTLAHPAVMLRKSALTAKNLAYDESFRRAQDYDLWARCAMANVHLANVPQVLVRYRLHANQATRRDSQTSRLAAADVRRRLIRFLGLNPQPEDLCVHEALSLNTFIPDEEFVSAAFQWLGNLAEANEQSRGFDQEAFLRALTGRFVSLGRFANLNQIESPDIAGTPFGSLVKI